MNLYSLSKNKRLIKSITQTIITPNSHLLLIATILALGGFFYSQITLANSTSLISTLSTPKNSPLSKLQSTEKQSTYPTNISLAQFDKKLEIKTISSQNKLDKEQMLLQESIANILIGTPMEKMIEPISQQDKLVAAFLVGIALKESGLGKHVPVLNGKDCHNYWGYRGKRSKMGTGGHTCFDSPEDAVKTVGKRIHTLAIEQKRNTPQKMLIWKCGSNCAAAGGWPAANKWVKDISTYFDAING